MSDHSPKPPQTPGEDPVREHVFDGIAEYDRRLPNWWLMTLYGSIVFSIVYWMATQHFGGKSDGEVVAATMQEIRAVKLAVAGTYDDETLREMSRNPILVAAGAAAYATTCVACHGANLEGGIGFNLADATWVHGDAPTAIMQVITDGVPGTGMTSWGPMLGPKKTAEVVAFVLSKQPAQ